jgi:dTDP-4-amino-4,6-dideoxygalactose transaminase
VKLAGEKLYGKPAIGHGAVEGKRVFCADMTFAATLNPVVYEGGIPVFIDTERDSWSMDPEALEKAFALKGRNAKVVVIPDGLGVVVEG